MDEDSWTLQREQIGYIERIASAIERYVDDQIETDKVLAGLLRDTQKTIDGNGHRFNVLARRLDVQKDQIADLQRLPNPADLAKRVEALEQTLPYFKERLAAIEETLADH